MKARQFVRLPSDLHRLIRILGRFAAGKGVTVYCVGGFVRDLMLKRRNLDLDVVVEGEKGLPARELASELKAQATLYSQFGTATLQLPNGGRLDLAAARQEHYPYPGALPVVRPGSIEDDLFRRDFTINAMAMRIGFKGFEGFVDPYNGQKDLGKKKIRVLHPKSFLDDPTRILRAVRFEQRFGFHIEPFTLRLMKGAQQKGSFATVKPARYFAEFRKILREEKPLRVMRRLQRLGSLDFLQKNFCPDWTLLSRIEKNISPFNRRTTGRQHDWSLVYLAALFTGMKPAQREAMGERFNLSRVERNVLSQSALARPLIGKLKKKRPASEVYLMLTPLQEEIIFFIRVQTSDKIVAQSIDDFWRRSRQVRPLLTGDDVKRMGIESGERIGEILRILLLNRIDQKLHSRMDEIRIVKTLLAQSGRTPTGISHSGQ